MTGWLMLDMTNTKELTIQRRFPTETESILTALRTSGVLPKADLLNLDELR